MLRTTKLAAACLSLYAGSAFAALPIINSSSSTGSTITINGSNLSGGTASVTLGSYPALTVTSQTATQLVANLPGGVSAGSYTLSVQIGSSKTNSTTSVATVGAIGPTGATGAQGPAGVTGATGPTGAAGATGAQGPQGLAGAVGPAGAKGDVGPQGATGLHGATGATGPQGLKGDTGAMGLQGPTGPQGPAGGPIGPTGPQGPMGPAGGPAPQLVDSYGNVAGAIYGTTNTSGMILALVKANNERLLVPFGWANAGSPGPQLMMGTTGYLAFASSDCSGTPYIVSGWGPYPGASKPSAIFQAAGGAVIYVSGGTAQTLNTGSVYYGGPPWGSNSMTPACYVSSGTPQVYPVDTAPINLNWTAPFSVQ